jgi:alpha-L-arabinofuranosidase
MATELNAADWTASELYPGEKGWPLVNDLGHALVLFDILGQHLLHPKVDLAQVWNTRWVHPTENQLWNTLDENNGFNATAHAVAIWGQNLKADMVAAASDDETVRVYASHDPSSHALSVFIINKNRAAVETVLELRGFAPAWRGDQYSLTGKDPEDPRPVFGKAGELAGEGNRLTARLAPISISVVTLRPA